MTWSFDSNMVPLIFDQANFSLKPISELKNERNKMIEIALMPPIFHEISNLKEYISWKIDYKSE